MNRRELVEAVSLHSGLERRQVDTILKGFADVVTAVVAKGEPVTISGFAKFVNVDRPARMGRNPQTQEPVRIKASKKARAIPLPCAVEAVLEEHRERQAKERATAGCGPTTIWCSRPRSGRRSSRGT